MSAGEQRVSGWFITTRDLLSAFLGTLGLVVTIISGMYFFFSTRDSSAAVMNDRVSEHTRRIDRLEAAIYGAGGLNEKFTDVQSKLSVIVNILQGSKDEKQQHR